MRAGKETQLYNQGYMDGYNEGENAHIDPDYWTRLEHQAAIAAMQGIWTNPYLAEIPSDKKVQYAYETSHALVEKMKEERRNKEWQK